MNELLSKIGLGGSLSQDVSFLIIIVIISVLLGTLVGRQRVIPILLGTYISAIFVKSLPGNLLSESYEVILFLVLIALITISGKKFLSGNLVFGSKIWKLFVFSFLEIVLIISLIFSMISKTAALGFVSSSVYSYFVSGWFPLIWLAAPLLFLLLACRRSRY
jgi:hypothetical protein